MTRFFYDGVRAVITYECCKDGVVVYRRTMTFSNLHALRERGMSLLDGSLREVTLTGLVDCEPAVSRPDMSNPLIFGASVRP